MEQYPDSIVITVIAAPTEVNGIYTAGASTNHTLKCRAEVNGTGRKIPGADGNLIDFAYQVFLPRMSTVIPEGSTCVLNSVAYGTVKRASNGQLNSRLWL